MASQHQPDYDVITIGAGFAGLGLIYYIREAGLSIRVFDKASDIGGTWTWNRYPGAASDSECYYYCLSFSKQLLQEWKWSVRYPGWEENLRYMHFVADQCDMWPHICANRGPARHNPSISDPARENPAGDLRRCRHANSVLGISEQL